MEKIYLDQKIIIPKHSINKSDELLDTLNSISNEEISWIWKDIEKKLNEPVHDLEWAKRAIYDDSDTLEHYKNYQEALKIISESDEQFLFLQM